MYSEQKQDPIGHESIDKPSLETEPQINTVAATYYRGDGLGFNHSLTLTSDGDFNYQRNSCMSSDGNSGKFRIDNGRVILESKMSKHWQKRNSMPTVFVPLLWGQRRYLLEETEIKGFFNVVESIGKPRYSKRWGSFSLKREPRSTPQGMFYLRREDWKLPVIGYVYPPLPWDPNENAPPSYTFRMLRWILNKLFTFLI